MLARMTLEQLAERAPRRGRSPSRPAPAPAAEAAAPGASDGEPADDQVEGVYLSADCDPLLALAELDADCFKVYRLQAGGRLAWLLTSQAPPDEEELLSLCGPGRYRVRAAAAGGALLAEVDVTLANRLLALAGPAQAPTANNELLKVLIPHVPALVQAIRAPGAAAAGVPAPSLGLGELSKLYQLMKEMQADQAGPEPDPEEADLVAAGAQALAGAPGAPWWAPLLAQVAQVVGGPGASPAQLSPATVAGFLSKPGALQDVVAQLQTTPEGLQLLAQVKEALA